MKLSLGFSSCPNDTFIFDAIVHQRIDLEGIEFEIIMEDVEHLNRRAIAGSIDVTKLSYHAFARLLGNYLLLDAGSALGNNCGPLLIAKEPLSKTQIEQGPIAIPGELTTANFLFSIAYPAATNKIPMLFSEIEEAVLNGRVKAGLIIHENRFTYQQKGLIRLIDLGSFWEEKTGLPIPLGGIAVRRGLDPDIRQAANRVLQRSVRHAFDHPLDSRPYVRAHAQEMDESVMQQHIDLYVNDYSLDLGPVGRKAVQSLIDAARRLNIIENNHRKIFLN